MDSSGSYPVYIGAWINWSRGPIHGATLTIQKDAGNLVIAMIAFFVAWVGTCFWRIACFAAHFAYSSRQTRDGIYHQRQAVLRNASDPESGVRTLAALAWAWRRRGTTAERSSWFRVLGMLVVSVIVAVGIVAASGFSSLVSSAVGNEVLLSGANCAAANFEEMADEDLNAQWAAQRVFDMRKAVAYAQACYTPPIESERTLGCNTFVRSKIDVQVRTDAGCPFREQLCKLREGNLLLDTGFIDSNHHLGINAPERDRFQFRRVMHCAPMVTEGHRTITNESDGRFRAKYYYGSKLLFNTPSDERARVDYTHEFVGESRKFETKTPEDLENLIAPDYVLSAATASYYNGSLLLGRSTFEPSNDMSLGNTDADIDIFFLSAPDIIFHDEVTDPWYNATRRNDLTTVLRNIYTGQVVTSVNKPVYLAREPAAPLGCKVQDQICVANPHSGERRCSRPKGPFAAFLDEDIWGLYETMEERSGLLWVQSNVFTGSIVSLLVNNLGTSALMSKFTSFASGAQGPLPSNQWTVDAQHWLEASLAYIQASVVSTVAGPQTPQQGRIYSLKPNTTAEIKLCQNQKILSTAYTSFSLLGFGLIFGLGGLIICVSYALEPFMTYLARRYRIQEYKQLEWNTNGTLQLQRLAHEGLGAGTWSKAADWIPVTRQGDSLAILDSTNPNHPRLRVVHIDCYPDILEEENGVARSNAPLKLSGRSGLDAEKDLGTDRTGDSVEPKARA